MSPALFYLLFAAFGIGFGLLGRFSGRWSRGVIVCSGFMVLACIPVALQLVHSPGTEFLVGMFGGGSSAYLITAAVVPGARTSPLGGALAGLGVVALAGPAPVLVVSGGALVVGAVVVHLVTKNDRSSRVSMAYAFVPVTCLVAEYLLRDPGLLRFAA